MTETWERQERAIPKNDDDYDQSSGIPFFFSKTSLPGSLGCNGMVLPWLLIVPAPAVVIAGRCAVHRQPSCLIKHTLYYEYSNFFYLVIVRDERVRIAR